MSQHCHFDASRSLTALEQDSTIIAVTEMSQTKWLVAALVHGVERQPLAILFLMTDLQLTVTDIGTITTLYVLPDFPTYFVMVIQVNRVIAPLNPAEAERGKKTVPPACSAWL